MRIGVDSHVFRGKFQGSRTYLSNLYNALAEVESRHQFTFFGQWNNEQPFGPRSDHIDYDSSSRLWRLTYGSNTMVKRHDIDLFHSTYISPLWLSCRQLVTIHDILFETHPHFFTKAFVYRSRALIRRSAKGAAQIHTISGFSRDAISNIYGIDPGRIKLVPVGVDHGRFNRANRDQAIERVAELTGLRDYILTVGRLEPRKNHVGLIEAYEMFRSRVDNPSPLLIVGQRDFGFEDIFAGVQKRNLTERVHFLESADDNMIADIYRAARMFVYPSFAEGFGIPVLEAMASGLPVITSNCTAIPEVIEDSGILIDPHNVDELAEALCRLHTDVSLRTDLAESGLSQSQRWTWDRAAQKYLEALDELE